MSQFDFGTIDPNVKTGSQLASDLNQWRAALHSTHSGVAQPAYASFGMLWVDQTNGSEWQLKIVTAVGGFPIIRINPNTGAMSTGAVFATAHIDNGYIGYFENLSGTLPNGLRLKFPAFGVPGTSNYYLFFETAVGVNFAVTSNGGIYNNQGNNVNTSDAGVKQDIVPAPDYMPFVEKLQYKRFAYVQAPDDLTDGVIAQDIAEQDGTLVTTTPDGKLGVYEHRLQQRINSVIPKLIERVKVLEEKLAALENK